jgi:hypothetical protein
MQKTSTEIHTIAERVRIGECEDISVDALCNEAENLFGNAIISERRKEYKKAVEYCRAACEDLDVAYEKSNDPDDFEKGKKKFADMNKRVRFHEHRIRANMYADKKRYHMLLDEVLAAQELYKELLEDNDESPGEFESEYRIYESDLRRLEGVARKNSENIAQLPKEIQLRNITDMMAKLEQAVAEERYEDAAVFRDKIKELQEK